MRERAKMLIPGAWAQAVIGVHGAAGRVWLAGLPRLIEDCERTWGLVVGEPFPLSMNYVAPAVRVANGGKVVLKLEAPCRELDCEIAALRHDDGRGMARLLNANPERGALLLERVTTGDTLASQFGEADDAEATRTAAEAMHRLWRPAPPKDASLFPSVAHWGQGFARLRAQFNEGTGPPPVSLVERAERLFNYLQATQDAPVLLHGDRRHFNILASDGARKWLAIDPKGVWGEPACEAGALLRNPYPDLLGWSDPARVLARRVEILADVWGMNAARIRDWGISQAVLSAWWTIEDGGDSDGWKYGVRCAELLSPGA